MNLKLIAAVAALVAAFLAGWTVNGYRWSAKYEAREIEIHQQNEKNLKAYSDKQTQNERDARAVAKAHQLTIVVQNARIAALTKEISDAQFTSQDLVHPFTLDFVQLLNRLSVAATGVSDSGAGPALANRDPAAAGQPAALTRGDLAKWYSEVAAVCGGWRQQLESIYKFDDEGATP